MWWPRTATLNWPFCHTQQYMLPSVIQIYFVPTLSSHWTLMPIESLKSSLMLSWWLALVQEVHNVPQDMEGLRSSRKISPHMFYKRNCVYLNMKLISFWVGFSRNLRFPKATLPAWMLWPYEQSFYFFFFSLKGVLESRACGSIIKMSHMGVGIRH